MKLLRRMFAEKSKLTDNYIPEDVAVKFVNMIAGVLGLEVSSAPVVVEAMSDDEFLELCSSGDAKAVEEALKNGAECSRAQRRHSARTARPAMSDEEFLELCQSGDAEAVEEALRHGANVNARDDKGATALMRAAFNGHAGVVEVLLRHGANLNARDNDGRSALDLAEALHHYDVAALLQAHGAK